MEAVASRPAAGQKTVAAPSRTKPILFAFIAAVVIAATLQWAASLRVLAQHDIFNLLVFRHLFVRYDAPFALYFLWAFVAALVAVYFVPARWFDALALWITDHVFYFAAFSFVVLGASAYLAYDSYPLALDEFAPYFQAQIFAAGHLRGHYPLDTIRGLLPLAGQYIEYSRLTGETYSGYWPGLALLITPWMFLAIPWVTNPLLGTAGIVVIRRLTLRLLPENPAAAGWAMLFMLASPAFFVNAISYYAMNGYVVSGLAYSLLLMELTPGRLVAAGVLGSFSLALHNPLPHTLFALPWIIWIVCRPNRWRNLFWLGLGYLPLTILLVGGWWWMNGQIVLDAEAAARNHSLSTSAAMAKSINPDLFGIPDYTAMKSRMIATLKLYLWAVPGLPVIAAWGFWRLRQNTTARLLAICAVVTYVFYFFVTPDQGHGWGYRYFHPAFGVLPLFGAAWVTDGKEGARWRGLMGVLAVTSLLVLTPLRLMQVHEFITQSENMAPKHDPDKHQVTFIYTEQGNGRYYAWDEVRNDPFLRNPSIVFVGTTLKEDTEFVKLHYPHAKLISQSIHGTVWDTSGDFPPDK